MEGYATLIFIEQESPPTVTQCNLSRLGVCQSWTGRPVPRIPSRSTWDQRVGYLLERIGHHSLEKVLEPDWGTSHPLPSGEQTENITLPHPSDAGGNYLLNHFSSNLIYSY